MNATRMTRLIPIVLLCACCSQAMAQKHIPSVPEAGDDARKQYEFERTHDPATGELPVNITERERAYVATLPVHDPFAPSRGSLPQTTSWLALGPRNQPGRTQAIAVDINDANNILLGSASGGVWRSIDRGQSWVKVTPPNEIQTVSAIVQDTRPGHTSTWYYSTSEQLSTTDRRMTTAIRTHAGGNGIFRSTDNGATWTPLDSTRTTIGHTAAVNFQGIWNLAIDVKDHTHDVIFAACMGGIMRSSDGGSTWSLVLGSDSARCFNSEIVIGTGGTMYAALGSGFDGTRSPKQGIWTSTDGLNWREIDNARYPALVRRVRLAVTPHHDSILYVFAETPTDWQYLDYLFDSKHTLLKCVQTTGGQSWTDYTPKLELMTQDLSNDGFSTLAAYAMVIAVSPIDPNIVVFGGTNLYRSFNGLDDPNGYQNLKIGGYPYNMLDGSLHPDMHVLEFDPTAPATLLVGTDGGMYTCTDLSVDSPFWYAFNNGLGSSQVYDARLDDQSSGSEYIIAGLQDNSSYLTNSMDPEQDWGLVSGGDGMTCSPINGFDYFVTSAQGGYTFLVGFDGTNLQYYGYAIPEEGQIGFAFYTRYVIDPITRNSMYLAQLNNLWMLGDLQSIPGSMVDNTAWVEYNNVGAAIGDANVISALACPQTAGTKMYLGSSDGKVYELDVRDDPSATVRDISSPTFPPGANVAHIEIDPADDRHLLVAFSNYNVQSLYESIDGGVAWHPVSGNLESSPDGSGAGPSVRTVRILRGASGATYYAGTSSGLFSTQTLDGMNTVWVREGISTIGALIVENIDVRQSDEKVICATQGGGVFGSNGPDAVTNVTSTAGSNLTVEQNYPNPVRSTTTIRFHLAHGSRVRISLYDASGKECGVIADGRYEHGAHLVEIDRFSPMLKNLSRGAYFYRITSGTEAVTKLMMLE